MNTLERFHIYREAYHNNYLNDQHTVLQNEIFEAIQKNEKRWEVFCHVNKLSILPSIITPHHHHPPYSPIPCYHTEYAYHHPLPYTFPYTRSIGSIPAHQSVLRRSPYNTPDHHPLWTPATYITLHQITTNIKLHRDITNSHSGNHVDPNK
jgi:hypothetical protein